MRSRAAPVMPVIAGHCGHHRRQRGHQVRHVAHVYAIQAFRPKQRLRSAVALRGIRLQAFHRHGASQGVGRQPEGCARPVAFHAHAARSLVALPARDKEALFRLLHRNAKGAHGRKRQVDVRRGFQRRVRNQFAVCVKQRQGKEQAGKILAGNIAGQVVFPTAQPAGDSQRQPLSRKARPMRPHGVYQRPFGRWGSRPQPVSVAPQSSSAARGKRKRNVEPLSPQSNTAPLRISRMGRTCSASSPARISAPSAARQRAVASISREFPRLPEWFLHRPAPRRSTDGGRAISRAGPVRSPQESRDGRSRAWARPQSARKPVAQFRHGNAF